MSYGSCRICSCTDNNACVHPDEGSCYWVDNTHELCSACFDHKIIPVVDILKEKGTDEYMSTPSLSFKLGKNNLLPLLRKMEDLGILKSKKTGKWVHWALMENYQEMQSLEIPELIKQFRVILWEDKITIDHPSDRLDIFQSKLNIHKELKIGWYSWIETSENALNYYECCGILILFGIAPPSYDELIGKNK